MRSFKKIAAMIMAVAMLCSFTALGANVLNLAATDVTIDTSAADTASSKITYSSDASQHTILAHYGENLSGANVVYIDQFDKGVYADGVNIILGKDDPKGIYKVWVGGTDVATAASTTFTYSEDTPAVALTLPETVVNGELSNNLADDADLLALPAGTKVTFTATPKFGYVLKSFTVNGDNKADGDAETFTVELTEDTTIAVEFAREDDYSTNAAYTYKDWVDVAAEEDEELSSTGETYASKVFFGKALAADDKVIKSMGMEVYKDGEGVKTKDGSIDTKFAANPEKIINVENIYKYGIRFYAFTSGGNYEIKAYVEYEDGEVVYGDSITFTVE